MGGVPETTPRGSDAGCIILDSAAQHSMPSRSVFSFVRKRGFALISVLIMMMLIVILSLGMLSLSSIGLRGSQNAEARARAQANARLALMMAIGQLQRDLGPDTRVTAPASQEIAPGLAQPHWVASYRTLNPKTGLPPVGRMADGSLREWSTDARVKQGKWRDLYRGGWLVSQADGGPVVTPQNPGRDLVTLAKLPGTAAGSFEEVKVPRVSVGDKNGKRNGTYAYWVTDEAAKARLDQLDPQGGDPGLTLNGKTNSLLMAQRADASKTAGYEWHKDLKEEIAAKLVSTGSLELASPDPKLASTHVDSFTVDSLGVLSDPVTGGLKMDLGAYLDTTGAGDPAIDLRARGRGVLSDSASFVPGRRYALTGAAYGSLRGWRRVGLDAAGSTTDPTQIQMEPRFPANRATTRAAGSSSRVYEGWIPETSITGRLEVTRASGGKELGVPVHPVIVDARFSMDFVYDGTANPPRILPLIYPRVKIWNPYNATLKAGNYVVVMPLRTSGGADFEIKGNGNLNPPPKVNLGTILNDSGMPPLAFRYFVFNVPAASFGPGECKVFMPDFSSPGPRLPRSGGSPYAILYDTANAANNRLTASASNSSNGAFFLNCTTPFPAAILAGSKTPTIRCTTDQHIFVADGWFLKGALKSPSMSAADILDPVKGRDFPSLQSIYCGIRGIDSYQGSVDDWEQMWDNAGERPFMSQGDGRLSGNVFAPRHWTRHLRLLYPGETRAVFASIDRVVDDNDLGMALASDWNPRANLVIRFPTSPSRSWYWRWRQPFVSPLDREESSVLAAGTASSGSSFAASPFWSESASAPMVDRFTFYDIQPQAMPLLSLARLRHVPLIPFNWQPTYPIGASRAPFFANADSTVFGEVAVRPASDHWMQMCSDQVGNSNFQDIVGDVVTSNDQMLVYDVAFDANAALFDRYFLSGLKRGATGRTVWNGTDPLANSRLKRYEGVYAGNPSTILTKPTDEALKPAAMFLQSGSFNVNSTDVDAWRTMLSFMRNTKRETLKGNSESAHPYSRVFTPCEPDGPSDPLSKGCYSGLAALDDGQIQSLSEAIVGEVKKRGPFLSLADFVNRRLAPDQSGNPDPDAMCGALDAAIASTSINGKAKDPSVEQKDLRVVSTHGFGSGGRMDVDYRHMSPVRTAAMPGCLSQGDLLDPLAPVLTVRGDTFVVRAYGEAVDPEGGILARAWCEAVVQRVPDYLQSSSGQPGTPGNEPSEPVLREVWSNLSGKLYATGELEPNDKLTDLNKRFGRAFRVTRFRWISPEEQAS